MLEVIDKGSGSNAHPVPLLFVHGANHAAWCWDEHFLDFFANKGYRALAVNLRGHGRSTASKPLRKCSVADYVDGWGNGKERATIRHVLTHTGGFPIPGDPAFDADITFDESVALVAESPALWEPGTKAGYHAASGWRILGAIVERVDGRRIDLYLRE